MRFLLIPWLISLFALLGHGLSAQECGCFNCNIPIPVLSRDTFEFVFDEVLNDNLASPTQGVCGVEIHFRHNRIRGVNMWLVSPSGQIVQLIGSGNVNPTSTVTSSASWDIKFLRNIDPASPDPGIPATWDNTSNWVILGQYTGTYYPFSGQLENFNIGSANGTWKLVIENVNGFSSYTGAVIDFRIILCDPTGIVCCFANGGNPTGALTKNVCENDSLLLLTTGVNYGSLVPDTAEFDYTWVIARDTIILDFGTVPDLRNYLPGNYQVCGLSYHELDVDSIPNPDGMLRVDTLRSRLNSYNRPFCGDISDRCYSIQISAPPDTTKLIRTICFGDSIVVGDSVFITTGNYSVEIPLTTGCDSIVSLSLTVIPTDSTFLTEVVCPAETFMVGDSTYSSTGIYYNHFISSKLCDSVVMLNLTVLEPLDTNFRRTICLGDSIIVGTTVLKTTGIYPILLTSTHGCDSLVTVYLATIEAKAVIQTPAIISCANASVTLNGSASRVQPLDYLWTTVNGQILSDPQQPTVSVGRSAWYYLNINKDSSNTFCAHTDSIFVAENFTKPVVNIGHPDTLTCSRLSVLLNAGGSSSGANFQYQWYFINVGRQLQGVGTTLSVNNPGTYRLVITNIINGCKDSAEIQVIRDIASPIAEAGPIFGLNCRDTVVTLNGAGSSAGSAFRYSWTGPSFRCCTTTLNPQTSQQGMYFLEVENIRNNCKSRDSTRVTRDVLAPITEAGRNDTLNCRDTTLQLSSSGSSGAGFSFNWTTTNGRILSGQNTLTPRVGSPGVYVLAIRSSTNFCESKDSLTIFKDTLAPIADAGLPMTLTCRDTAATIGGTGTSSGSNFGYNWLLNGNLINGATANTLRVNSIGIYTLRVTNSSNHCTSTDGVVVDQDVTAPVAEAGNGFELNCLVRRDTLDGSNSSAGANFLYVWSTVSGCILTNQTLPMIEVGCVGIYYLQVRNQQNGCISTDSVEVTRDLNLPVAEAGNADTLNCRDITLQLNGTGSVGPNFRITWTTLNGNILSGGASFTPLVNGVGRYYLTVTDTLNFCQTMDSVEIYSDVVQPIADAGQDGILTCKDTLLNVGGTGTSTGANYAINWFINGVNLGIQSPTFQTSQPGRYIIEVQNTANFCSSRDTVDISEDKQLPFVDAGNGFELNCTVLSDTLDGRNSSAGANFSYSWSAANPCFQTPTNQVFVVVNCPNVFYLTVENVLNNCRGVDSVEVTQDANLPTVNAGLPDTLTCRILELTLNGSANPLPPSSNLQWTTANGRIVRDANTLTPTIDRPGTYTLTVTRLDNNCSRTSNVTITELKNVPVSDAGLDAEINCDTTLITLGGPNSSTGTNIRYQWTFLDGTPIPGANSSTYFTSSGGDFVLEIVDEMSECASRDTVFVEEDLNFPVAEAGNGFVLDCQTQSDTLDGSGSSTGSQFSYFWTTLNGHFVNGQQTINPVVDRAGVYYLRVLNEDNHCSSNDSTRVTRDTNVPIAIAQDSIWLPCPTREATLDGTGSSVSLDIEYRWTTLSGNILSGETTLTPVVNLPGSYTLEVIDNLNNCIASTTIQVFDTIHPVANAGGNAQLDCYELNSGKILDGTGSSQGPHFQYFWTTSGGNFISRTDTITPVVNAAGFYNLQVIDIRNNCVDEDDIAVTLSQNLPVANAGPNFDVPCGDTTATIDGSVSSSGADIVYLWTTRTGNIRGAVNTATLLVDTTGYYVLNVTNTTIGCTAVDSVFVNFQPCSPNVSLIVLDTVDCITTEVRLDASGSDLTNATYSWQALGGIILADANSLRPLVSAGRFRFTLLDTTTNLSSSSEVVVVVDSLFPMANAGGPGVLTCLVKQVQLDGSASTAAHNFDYQWQGAAPIQDENAAIATVSAGGLYQLIITDNVNGCKDTAFVNVTYDTLSPRADAGADLLFPCDTAFIILDGTNSSQGANFLYKWSNNDTTLFPRVNQTGQYCLTVTNRSNGCESTDCVDVDPNQNAPIISAGVDGLLTCKDSVVRIQGSFPIGNMTLDWATADGCILTAADQSFIDVNCEGNYIFTVTDNTNRCQSSVPVTVQVEKTAPLAEAGIGALITCTRLTVQLNGIGSSAGSRYAYSWQGPSINSGNTTLQPVIDAAGEYFLMVTDTSNGCIALDSVVVGLDTVKPVVDAGSALNLSCKVKTVILQGFATASHGYHPPQWQALSGLGIVSGANSFRPVVDAAGLCVLTIQDSVNGCVQTDTVSVGLDTISPSGKIGFLGQPILNCLRDTMVLDANAFQPQGNLVYRWNTLTGNILSVPINPQVEIDKAGWYFLTVERIDNGCVKLDSIFVDEDFEKPETVILPPDTLTCDVHAVVIQSVPITPNTNLAYLWQTTSGSIRSSVDQDSVLVDLSARYSLEVTDLDNGCIFSTSVIVPIDTVPPVAVALVERGLDCVNLKALLDGSNSSQSSGGFEYRWTTTGTGILETPNALKSLTDAEGWYFFSVKNLRNGCASTDSVEVKSSTPPIQFGNISARGESCYGSNDGVIRIDSITGGTPPFSYSISEGFYSNYFEFNNLSPGRYAIKIEDAAGCEWDTLIIIEPTNQLLLELGEDQTIRLGDSAEITVTTNLNLQDIRDLIWQPAVNDSCVQCPVVKVSPFITTTYALVLRDSNGCAVSDEVTVYVNANRPVYIPNIFSPNGDDKNDIFLIFGTEAIANINSFRIYDRWGNTVFEAKDFQPNDPNYGWNGTFKGKEMNPAVFVYIAEITFVDGKKEVFEGEVTLYK